MLGASHTVPGGEHADRAPGPVRARWGSQLLRGAGVSVAGLQELEPSQYAAFRAATPGWDAYPGSRLVRKSTANSIVWDTSVWTLVEAHTIAIPYFHGRSTPMPYLELRDRRTGRKVWFANFHNPADVHGPAARFRSVAVAREVALANQLTASGTPLVMTGDMNDREAYFCPMTTRTGMHAALGGSTGPSCAPPGDMTVDWIMGSPDVAFSNYHSVRGGLVYRTSDHHFLWTDATVGASAASVR
nr:endonuclease/exonuclease/phosphatase family protein [Nocardioides panaciterrulae]